MLRALKYLRRAIWKALAHEVLTLSKSAAYSAILGLFPAILVGTAVLALMPQNETITGEVSSTLSDFLPTDTMSAIQIYFQAKHGRSTQVLITALLVSIFGAMGVMTSFIEGFRRAYGLEKGRWTFWRERVVAIGLIPFSLIPLLFATGIVAFGHQIETFMLENSTHTVRHFILFVWRMVRWAIAVGTTAIVLAIVYRYGTPWPRRWRSVLPGAAGATVIWFLATLFFGWYVTRFADYSVVYGSLGTAIATLVWLYITCFSVFIGGELNAQVYPMEAFVTPQARGRQTVDLHDAEVLPAEEHSPTV
jgi:membrane protein